MKALQLSRFIPSLEHLPKEPVDLPTPKPNNGEVLVRVYAVGANFFDILLVQGQYQYRPKGSFVPGSEFAGVIEAVGPDVMNWQVGERVFGGVNGGAYATHVVAKACELLPVPKNISLPEAAGIYITYPTSYAALVLRAQTKKGETVLVHAGAGGVGLAAIQIAKLLGAKVIATASTADKLQVMRDNGADYVINYKNEDWVARVQEITKKRGVDVVFDPVGLIGTSLKVAAWNARLVVVGFAGFPPGQSESITTNRVLLKNVSVMGLFWGNYRIHEREQLVHVWSKLLDWLGAGKLHPIVYRETFRGLESIGAALHCLQARKSYGKIVVSLLDEQNAKL